MNDLQSRLRFLISKKYSLWALLWLAITGISNLFLIPNGFTYVKEPGVIALFFVAASLYGAKHYRLIERPFLKNFPLRTALQVILFAALIVIISRALIHFTPLAPSQLLNNTEEKLQLPQFSISFWISKIAEILFQQTFILGLIRMLQHDRLDKKELIAAFTIFFTVIHFPLIIILNLAAFYFIVPSFFAGLIFSNLIVNFKNGILYSYVVHLLFYLGLGTYLRIGLM